MRAMNPAGSDEVSGALGPVSDVTRANVIGAGDEAEAGAARPNVPTAEPMQTAATRK